MNCNVYSDLPFGFRVGFSHLSRREGWYPILIGESDYFSTWKWFFQVKRY